MELSNVTKQSVRQVDASAATAALENPGANTLRRAAGALANTRNVFQIPPPSDPPRTLRTGRRLEAMGGCSSASADVHAARRRNGLRVVLKARELGLDAAEE